MNETCITFINPFFSNSFENEQFFFLFCFTVQWFLINFLSHAKITRQFQNIFITLIRSFLPFTINPHQAPTITTLVKHQSIFHLYRFAFPEHFFFHLLHSSLYTLTNIFLISPPPVPGNHHFTLCFKLAFLDSTYKVVSNSIFFLCLTYLT